MKNHKHNDYHHNDDVDDAVLRAIVVHAGVDDLGKGGVPDSLTTGNAGGRFAGMITIIIIVVTIIVIVTIIVTIIIISKLSFSGWTAASLSQR